MVRARAALAVTLTALVFALYHLQFGVFGTANALVFALFAAAARQRWPDNLWVLISLRRHERVHADALGYL